MRIKKYVILYIKYISIKKRWSVNMIIKQATKRNIEEILNVYKEAREYMALNGNKEQWGDNYPPRELIEEDIETNKCYIAVDEIEEMICGVFYFAIENDPMYNFVDEGQWLNQNEYAVVHRIAVSMNGHNKGIASKCLDFAVNKIKENNIYDLKMDTHRDNLPMQRFLEKKGFVKCGVVYVNDGTERLAYHKIIL